MVPAAFLIIPQWIRNAESVSVFLSVLTSAPGTCLRNRRNSKIMTNKSKGTREIKLPGSHPRPWWQIKNDSAGLKVLRDHFSPKNPLGKKSHSDRLCKETEGPSSSRPTSATAGAVLNVGEWRGHSNFKKKVVRWQVNNSNTVMKGLISEERLKGSPDERLADALLRFEIKRKWHFKFLLFLWSSCF